MQSSTLELLKHHLRIQNRDAGNTPVASKQGLLVLVLWPE